jgi:hypothetical protein
MRVLSRCCCVAGVCGVVGFGVATVNAVMTFINIAAGDEDGADDGQCGVPPVL